MIPLVATLTRFHRLCNIDRFRPRAMYHRSRTVPVEGKLSLVIGLVNEFKRPI